HKLTDLEKNKVNVGKDKAPKHKAPVKNPTAVVYKARKQKTPVKKPAAVVEKPYAIVDKAPKHKAPAKKPASVVVQDKDNVTAPEKDKEKHKALAKEPDYIMGRVCDVAKQIMFHVEDALKNEAADVKDNDKAKDNAPNPKDKKSKAHSDVVPVTSSKQKVNPYVKSKVVVRVSKSKETHVKRKRIVSIEDDRKKKLKGKSKKEDSDSELETDFVDSSSDEADRKRKKLKIKAGLKRKRSGSDSSDSSSIDTTKVKRLISKLEKKVKKQESDEESVPKKGKKKMTKKIKKEESDEESVPKKGFSSLHNVSIDQLPSKLGWFVVSKFENYMLSLDTGDKIEVTYHKIHDMLGVPVGGYSLFDLDEREADHEFVKLWVGQFHPLELRDLRVNDIARKLVAAKEIDFLFKVNFLTIVLRIRCISIGADYIYGMFRDSKTRQGKTYISTIGPLTFLILLYLDSTKFDRFPVVPRVQLIRKLVNYLMRQRQSCGTLKSVSVGLFVLISDLDQNEVKDRQKDLFKRAEEKLASICSERVRLEDLLRKANSDYHDGDDGDDDDGDEDMMMMLGVMAWRMRMTLVVLGHDEDGRLFSITNTTSMTILDNMDSGATYDSKYKQPCDLLVRIKQISQENGQNRTNTDTGTDRVQKSRKISTQRSLLELRTKVEPEIRTIVEVAPMAERTMEELLRAPTEGYEEAIVLLEINADHFEIKTNLLQLVQANPFHGLENENPHAHINSFKRITSTLRFRNVPNDVIKLMMFPYSLEGLLKTFGTRKKPA
ncbi:hypothetical protein Tco_1300697, partial [Tanacetum coccineum]